VSDLKDRMQRQLRRPSTNLGESPPDVGESSSDVGGNRPYAHRVTLDLTAEDHRALKVAAAETDVPMADRLRALVALWREDPSVAAQVEARAAHLRAAMSERPKQTGAQ
jgi:hypothetical protein